MAATTEVQASSLPGAVLNLTHEGLGDFQNCDVHQKLLCYSPPRMGKRHQEKCIEMLDLTIRNYVFHHGKMRS